MGLRPPAKITTARLAAAAGRGGRAVVALPTGRCVTLFWLRHSESIHNTSPGYEMLTIIIMTINRIKYRHH